MRGQYSLGPGPPMTLGTVREKARRTLAALDQGRCTGREPGDWGL